MRLHHLNCGTMRPPLGRLFGAPVGWLDAGRWICHCLLIETDQDGLVLVDSGFGTGDLHDRRRIPESTRRLLRPDMRIEETAVEQVRVLGFSPADVRHVVLTHLDLDHAGGLSDFPDAKVHVHAPEVRAASVRTSMTDHLRYRPAQWEHQPHWETYEDEGDDWNGLRALRPLRGVRAELALVPLMGHTRGHSGVAVRTGMGEGEWLLHGGDAYFHHGEMETTPRAPLAIELFQRFIQVDGQARVENQRRLRELAERRRGEVRVFCAHDPVDLDSFTNA